MALSLTHSLTHSLTLDSNAACNCAFKLHCACKLHYAFAAASATYNYLVPMISSDLLELLFSLVFFLFGSTSPRFPVQDHIPTEHR